MNLEANAVLQEVKAQLNGTKQPKEVVKARKSYGHTKSLEARIISALNNDIRTAKTIHSYIGNDVSIKVLNMTLGRLVAKGKIGKKFSIGTGQMKYYPYEIAKEKGILQQPKAKVAKPSKIKVKKPKITEDGLYEDGMETPWRDAIMRSGGIFTPPRSLELAKSWLFEKAESETKTTQIHNELMAENRRLKVLVEHYESLLFKGGK